MIISKNPLTFFKFSSLVLGNKPRTQFKVKMSEKASSKIVHSMDPGSEVLVLGCGSNDFIGSGALNEFSSSLKIFFFAPGYLVDEQ